jgi:hypothetical protein
VPRSIRPLLTLCALALLVPAAAQAQAPAPTMIDGTPLNVWASADGGVQANVDGYTRSEWFPYVSFDPTTGTEIPSPNANAGFGLVVNPESPNGSQYFGRFIAGGLPAPTSGPTLTPGNPATITATWTLNDFSGSPLIELTQVLSYTNGSRQFDATYTVKNVSSAPLTFRATMAGDMAIRGSDTGIGFLNPGPPRFVGGLNQEVGAAGGFVEETPPWSHYEVGQYGTVGQHARDNTPTGGLNDTLNTEPVDNGAGVQWDDHFAAGNELAPGAEAVYKVGEKFIDTLGLTPPTDQKLTGDQAVLTATVGDLNGNPATANQTINYTIQGSNNLSGKVQTGTDGKATISYVGGSPGTDTVTAFVDANGNDTRDVSEAQAVATIEWQGPPAPVIGTSADVRPVKGTVKIKLPPGFSVPTAKRLGLQGAATSFVKLTTATQIPMGSTLDTSKGTVNLLSAGSKDSFAGKFNSGNFNGGQFRLTQSTKNPLTQLSMKGGGLKGCNTRVPRGGAARSRSRRLFGNAHGRFRTRGRNSSATVRGTKWTMTDTCAGTLTSVKSGTVVVRDFRLHKNKKVKAGHKYFARATKLRRVKK